MGKVLVIFQRDWADEFDISGFAIYEKDKWEKDVKAFSEAETYNSFYFGTNQCIEDEEIGVNFLNYSYKVKDISDSEAEVFEKFFNKSYHREILEFGTFPHLEELIEGHVE